MTRLREIEERIKCTDDGTLLALGDYNWLKWRIEFLEKALGQLRAAIGHREWALINAEIDFHPEATPELTAWLIEKEPDQPLRGGGE